MTDKELKIFVTECHFEEMRFLIEWLKTYSGDEYVNKQSNEFVAGVKHIIAFADFIYEKAKNM